LEKNKRCDVSREISYRVHCCIITTPTATSTAAVAASTRCYTVVHKQCNCQDKGQNCTGQNDAVKSQPNGEHYLEKPT